MPNLRTLAVCLTAILMHVPLPALAAPQPDDHWVGTWASSPLVPSSIIENEQLQISNSGTTLREIVRITLGGDSFRVRFTNLFGTRPLTIGAAEMAETLVASSIKPGTSQPLHFHGQSSVIIPREHSSTVIRFISLQHRFQTLPLPFTSLRCLAR